VDTNGDVNIVDEKDRVHYREIANLVYFLGFHADLNYKGFNFSAVSVGHLDMILYDAIDDAGIGPTQKRQAGFAVALQRWGNWRRNSIYLSKKCSPFVANDNTE